MGLSSNSVVHFTKDKESLKGILAENFKIKYCREEIPREKKPLVLYVPMVSFCDIPLSQVKEHINAYGSYGIGLTREWAVRNRLNPVLYIQNGSFFAESYHAAIKYFYSEKIDDLTQERFRAEERLLELFRYAKPYEGPLKRIGKATIPSYRFSDEREWRYAPPATEGINFIYGAKAFDRDVAAESVAHLRLNFEPSDIKYIIINDDSEISDFVRHLDDVKGANYSKRDVEIVTTRIITAEQIKTDF